MFGHFKYTPKQKSIVDQCIEKNKEERDKWFFHNLWYPISIILLSLILVAITTQDFDVVVSKVLEGGISLLGINVLFAMSSYLIRSKMFVKDDLRNEVVNLAAKFGDWKTLLIVLGTILYVLPTLYSPTSLISKLILFATTVIILLLSIKIALRIFIIRDDFYKKTYNLNESFESKIREGSEEHGKDW